MKTKLHDLGLWDIAILDYTDAKVVLIRRAYPMDVQTDDIEAMLTAEGIYNGSTCYFMTKLVGRADDNPRSMVVEDNR